MDTPPPDPVLVRRAQVARWSALAKRVGYSLYAVACVTFVVGFATRLTDTAVTVIVTTMVVGSILLAPAIVLAYGVKAADREDRKSAAAGPGSSGTPAPGPSGTPAPGPSGTPAPGPSGTPAPGARRRPAR